MIWKGSSEPFFLAKISVDINTGLQYNNYMNTTITYHPEKEFGYQWKLSVTDNLSKMTIHFETKKQAEQYVIMSMLQFGEVI